MKLILIRHGKSADDAGGLMQREDAPLAANAHEQLGDVKERMGKESFAAIFVSPLTRARQTADLLFGNHPKVEVIDSLFEYRRPRFLDGASQEVGREFWEVTHRENKFDPDWKHDDGESFNDIVHRAKSFVMRLDAFQVHESICVVGHGNFFRHLLGVLAFGEAYDTQLYFGFMRKIVWANGAVVALDLEQLGNRWQLKTMRFE